MLAERIKKWPEQWEERGMQKGMQKGIQEGRQEVARNLISMNLLDDAQIAAASSLTEAEVKALRAEVKY
ncbi:hypothetical protein GLV89_06520 [Halomonas alkaliantarctica]|nr:hypothetical protein [Halomonas alkaliantarctica]